jgi:hydrogenase maturation protease
MTGRWTVLVCGDRSRGDDGAALVAMDRLAPALPPSVDVRRVGQLDPVDLVDALAAGRCVVLDAVRGVPPGQVVGAPLAELGHGGPSSASTHALPLPTVVGLADALGADLDAACFLGIGGDRFELGGRLSRPVRRGLAGYVAAIADLVGDREALPCA